MPIVKTTELADADLDGIWNYFAENNLNAANKIIDEFAAKFRLLAENPLMGKSTPKFVINLRRFLHKNYLIFYFPIEEGIEIFRVLHASRNIASVFDEFFEGLDE